MGLFLKIPCPKCGTPEIYQTSPPGVMPSWHCPEELCGWEFALESWDSPATLRAQLEGWQRKMMAVTPGGSEFTTPEAIAEFVRQKLTELVDANKYTVRLLRQLTTAEQRVRALEEVLDAAPHAIRCTRSAIMQTHPAELDCDCWKSALSTPAAQPEEWPEGPPPGPIETRTVPIKRVNRTVVSESPIPQPDRFLEHVQAAVTEDAVLATLLAGPGTQPDPRREAERRVIEAARKVVPLEQACRYRTTSWTTEEAEELTRAHGELWAAVKALAALDAEQGGQAGG